MTITLNGILYSGTPDEIDRIIELDRKRKSGITISTSTENLPDMTPTSDFGIALKKISLLENSEDKINEIEKISEVLINMNSETKTDSIKYYDKKSSLTYDEIHSLLESTKDPNDKEILYMWEQLFLECFQSLKYCNSFHNIEEEFEKRINYLSSILPNANILDPALKDLLGVLSWYLWNRINKKS